MLAVLGLLLLFAKGQIPIHIIQIILNVCVFDTCWTHIEMCFCSSTICLYNYKRIRKLCFFKIAYKNRHCQNIENILISNNSICLTNRWKIIKSEIIPDETESITEMFMVVNRMI